MPRNAKTTKRGYGWKHQQRRQKWVREVALGHVLCARCGKLIYPREPWDLGHSADRTEYTGPEHVRCNRATNVKRKQSRKW